MYEAALVVHNALRWVVVLAGLVAVGRAVGGWAGQRPWTPMDASAGRWFVLATSLQFLVGLVLYAWLSPITHAAFADMGWAMRNAPIRFWAVEHVTPMFLALGLVHAGAGRVRKARRDPDKHRAAVMFYGVGLLLILIGIPWMGANARPLFRWFA